MKKCFFCLFAIVSVIATTGLAQVPVNGLVLWYPFSGNANDSSTSANHGMVTNATLTTDRFGRANKAYRFYGINNGGPSTVVSQNRMNITGVSPRTVSFWFNWYSVYNPEAPGILGWGSLNNNIGAANWFHIKQDSSMVMRGHYQDFYSTVGIIHTRTWTHIVYTYDGVKGIFYINGNKNTTASFVSATDSSVLQIGHSTDTYLNPFDWPAYFDGAIDDIRIYNRALDSAEVKLLYADGGYGLPLHLLSFRCSQNDKAIQLIWQTSNEVNTSHFFVQRGSDGQSFTNVCKVESSKTAGEHTYRTLDKHPITGINYYRLQMVDKDAKTAYSKIVRISLAPEQDVMLSPNPSSSVFKLSVNTARTEALQLRVVDINGKTVYNAKGLPTQAFTFGEALTSGVYLIEVRQGNDVKTTKAVKN